MPHKRSCLLWIATPKLWWSVSLSTWIILYYLQIPISSWANLYLIIFISLQELFLVATDQPSAITIWYYLVASICELWNHRNLELLSRSLGLVSLPAWSPALFFLTGHASATWMLQVTGKALPVLQGTPLVKEYFPLIKSKCVSVAAPASVTFPVEKRIASPYLQKSSLKY